MRILITSAGQKLSKELVARLRGKHQIRLTERRDISTDLDFVRSDLGHDKSTNDLVKGMDAVVHSGQVGPAATASEQLDFQTRCTYNLLHAATEEGVPHFIYLSSLAIMKKYDEGLAVTEQWRPVPTTEPTVLGYHLGEYVCREFVRENRITAVVLRLGDLVYDGKGGGAVSPSALHIDDAAHAVERALSWGASCERPTGGITPSAGAAGWGVFHIQSPVPNARFQTSTAHELLGYEASYKG